jgi:hypothetical protein
MRVWHRADAVAHVEAVVSSLEGQQPAIGAGLGFWLWAEGEVLGVGAFIFVVDFSSWVLCGFPEGQRWEVGNRVLVMGQAWLWWIVGDGRGHGGMGERAKG